MSGHDAKANHVRRQSQDRRHECHWPDCPQQVPPAMWGCKAHWFALPKWLRDRVWDAYVPGQEQRMDPSDEYLGVAREVQEWIESQSSWADTVADEVGYLTDAVGDLLAQAGVPVPSHPPPSDAQPAEPAVPLGPDS